MNIKDKYVFSLVIISIMVVFLTHFPELASLFDVTGQNASSPDTSVLDVANEVFFTFVSLLLLLAMNTYVFGFNRQKVCIFWQKVLLSPVMTQYINNLLEKGFVFLHRRFNIPAIDALVHYYLHSLRDFIMSCVATGGCCMIYLIRQSQQVQAENQQLRVENLLNQYEASKNQLNPHMLLSSLNTLRSLIRGTPGKAREYLQELSRVLRYTLQGNRCRSITLQEETDFTNAYVFLLKMRYEDSLVFDIGLREKHGPKQLSPMSVQPLIGNVAKYNEISNRRSLTISTCSGHDSLTVSNPTQPRLAYSGGADIDLVNLSKRHNLLYKRDISIKEDTSISSVTIPLVWEL